MHRMPITGSDLHEGGKIRIVWDFEEGVWVLEGKLGAVNVAVWGGTFGEVAYVTNKQEGAS